MPGIFKCYFSKSCNHFLICCTFSLASADTVHTTEVAYHPFLVKNTKIYTITKCYTLYSTYYICHHQFHDVTTLSISSISLLIPVLLVSAKTFCGASRLPTVVREYNGFKFEPLAFSVYF